MKGEKILKITLTLFIVFIYKVSNAQQEPNYMLYRYSMNIINPAYAGSDKNTSLTTNIRSQWVNIEGALKTQSLFYAQPIGNNIGVGLSVVNDNVFIENQTSFNIDFSYQLQLSSTANIFLGLKAGGGTYSLETHRIKSTNLMIDPVLNNFNTGFKPNIGMGIYLKHNDYFLSLSIPSLLSNKRINKFEDRITQATEEAHIYLAGGYNFALSKNTTFRPSFITRYVNNVPVSIDFTAAIRFIERFEVALAYRTDQALSGFFMINFSDWMDLGYAYDRSIRSEISGITEGTHELLLRFTFNRKDYRRR